jgi:hypothetical protein
MLFAAPLTSRMLSNPQHGWTKQATRPAREIIACANGLLHLPTRRLLPHTPSFFTLNALDYAYDPGAPAPHKWLTFLEQVWPDDPEAIETLRRTVGYLLTADTSQQKAFLIVGPRRSGKGTIGRALARLVGPHNYAAPTLSSLGERFGLSPLIGKNLAIISDARISGHSDQQVIVERLLSITGEDGQTIDRNRPERSTAAHDRARATCWPSTNWPVARAWRRQRRQTGGLPLRQLRRRSGDQRRCARMVPLRLRSAAGRRPLGRQFLRRPPPVWAKGR